MAVNVHQLLGGAEMSNIEEYIGKYLDKVLYGNPIMEKSLQPAYKILHAFKDITSKLTLGFNLRSGMREILQGTYIGANRAFANQLTDQIDEKNYIKAYTYVITELPKSIDKIHFLE